MISSATIGGLRRSLAETPRLRALLTKLIVGPTARARAKR
jgi:hypothetical protein